MNYLKRKSQASLEFIIILGVSLLVILIVIQLSQDSMGTYQKMLTQSKTKSFLNEITSAAQLIYQQGTGAKTQLYITVPPNINNITIASRKIVVDFKGGDKQYRNFDFDAIGDIPSSEGGYWIDVEAIGGLVVISTNSSNISLNYSFCGNDEQEISEECDGIDFGGKSCATFGYIYGPLRCANCTFDTSDCYNRGGEICDDGVDNDDNGLVDCLDPICVGSIGPFGGFCCVGDSSNCPGVDNCKTCGADNECDFNGTTSICNIYAACSNAGDNGYSMRGAIPSYGYCDGFGNCDYALSPPICDYSLNNPGEETGKTTCREGSLLCVDSCSDLLDNDYNGCTDKVDYKCGGFETSCSDGIDNDCDGTVDCLDTDCNGFVQTGELPNNQFNEILQWNWPNGSNMEKNVLLLHLNELAGTLADTSGFGNSCTSSGGVVYGTKSMFNTALNFSGTNAYLDCARKTSLFITNAITVSAWVNHSSSNTAGYIVNFGGSDKDFGYALSWNSGNIRVELQKLKEKRVCNNVAPSNGAWHNIAFTWDSTNRIIRTYIDGVQAPTTCTFTGPIGAPTINFNIGRGQNAGLYYEGAIDEVAVLNRSLTATEILNNYLRKDYCLTHDCTFSCGVENCTNGLDDNGNYLIDCADPICKGITGPNGSICCAGDKTNCPGADPCKECKLNNECGMLSSATMCSTAYQCSIAGIGGYGLGGRVPSQGYCNGNGTCDTALTTPLCTFNVSNNSEVSASTACVEDNPLCVNTCTDGIDNDLDGCTDSNDSSCGAIEVNCVDGKDNDCDGLADCNDADCLSNPACTHQETNCTDGIDNDLDTYIDCADNDCIGKIGPNGITCCAGNAANCLGHPNCKICTANNECSYSATSTICNDLYYCSNSGDNGYNLGGRVPSRGYCDGFGSCDYAASMPLCTIAEEGIGEGTTVSVCVDSLSTCRNTCTDGIDNDLDSCTDSVDSACGGIETSCIDGIDNDCDSLIDCYDSDCATYVGCMACANRLTCGACEFDGQCKWCGLGFCTDICKTGTGQNCRGGTCYNSCP